MSLIRHPVVDGQPRRFGLIPKIDLAYLGAVIFATDLQESRYESLILFRPEAIGNRQLSHCIAGTQEWRTAQQSPSGN